ncbi:MAG: hypothetical protein AAGB32_04050 [Pseudomonadota bacterium]
MVQKSLFAVRLLDKIGAPLVSAIESAPPEKETDAAEMMAKMLGQAVKMSIGLAGALNIEETEEQADSTRLSIAALSTPLLADFYRQHKRVPEEADITRMTKSLEAVIAFADKFTPAAEGQSRLTTIDQDMAFFDETQAVLTSLQALTPVILAVNEFSFGQSEAKLLQEVADRLEKDAVALSGAEKNKMGQIIVLKALASVYADCHRAEVQRMSAQDDESRQTPTLDPIWKNYDRQVKMMEALTGAERDESAGSSKSSAPQAPQKPAEPVVDAPKESAKPAEAPPPAPEKPAEAPASGGGSPMGFFSKGGDAESAQPADKPAEASTPAPEAPKETNAPETPATPPAETSEPAQPTETKTDSDATANPMGFFKPGAKKEDDA